MVVYLDTNVYYGAKFVFDRGKFETLKNFIKSIFDKYSKIQLKNILEQKIYAEHCKANSLFPSGCLY